MSQKPSGKIYRHSFCPSCCFSVFEGKQAGTQGNSYLISFSEIELFMRGFVSHLLIMISLLKLQLFCPLACWCFFFFYRQSLIFWVCFCVNWWVSLTSDPVTQFGKCFCYSYTISVKNAQFQQTFFQVKAVYCQNLALRTKLLTAAATSHLPTTTEQALTHPGNS